MGSTEPNANNDTTYAQMGPDDMAAAKGGAGAAGATHWRADLWDNVPSAINWANTIPVSQPGEIIFNIRDNGQVWTYTFVF